MKSSIIGLDIVKRVFHVYTIQADGKVFKKMLRRKQVLEFFDNYPSSLIGIEACSSSHYWARELTTLDYEVKKGSCRPRVCENSRFTNSVEKQARFILRAATVADFYRSIFADRLRCLHGCR